MVLTIENEELLKRWLKGEIILLNDNADPIHLSDYIISIVKQNNNTSKTIEQTKAFCKEQLTVFLKDKTTNFVESLVQVLEDNSYIVDFDEDDEGDQMDENDNNDYNLNDHDDDSDNNDDRVDDKDDRVDDDNNDDRDSRKRQKLDENEYQKKDNYRQERISDNHHYRQERGNNMNRGNDRRQHRNTNDRRNFGGNLMLNNMPYNMGHPMGMMGMMGPMGMMGIGPHGYPMFNPMMNGPPLSHGYGAYLDKKPNPPSGPPPAQLNEIVREENFHSVEPINSKSDHSYNNYSHNSQQNKYYHQQQSKWGEAKNNLPEVECCTLKCNGIPSKVTSEELKNHFRSFGRIVEIQMVEVPPEKNDTEKKIYNECLVQFASAVDAKKCLNSPIAVLNNRFIKLSQSHFNIIPVEDVKPLTTQEQYEEEQERDRIAREKKGPKVFNKSITKKYVRSDDKDQNTEGEYIPKMKPTKVLAAKQKAEVVVKNQYDDLRKLREQAELISKKKEQIIETQIENYRILIAKAQQGKDEHIWEAKIMDLQRQLNALRNERESAKKPEIRSPQSYAQHSSGRIPNRGGRGGRMSYRGGRVGGRIRESGRDIEITADNKEAEDLADSYINGFSDTIAVDNGENVENVKNDADNDKISNLQFIT